MDPRRLISLLLLLGLLAGNGCRGLVDELVTSVPPPPAGPRHDVRQARATLVGQSPAAIVSALGQPDHLSTNGAREWWLYFDRFHDPVTGRDLPQVTFRFHQDKLEAVNF